MCLFLADVDECASGFDECEQFCVNTAGSYICVCFPGYHLLTNGFSCSGECKCTLTATYKHFMEVCVFVCVCGGGGQGGGGKGERGENKFQRQYKFMLV